MPSKYTEAEKDEAVRLFAEVGAGEASHRLINGRRIPKESIRTWAKQRGIKSPNYAPLISAMNEMKKLRWEQRRLELADQFGEGVAELYDLAMFEARRSNTKEARDLFVSLGILIDKSQLLSGGATTRSGKEGSMDEEIKALEKLLADNDSKAKSE